MSIYEIVIGETTIETDSKPTITQEVKKLKKKGLEEGKDFHVQVAGMEKSQSGRLKK